MSVAHAAELQDDLSAPEAAEVYEAPSVLRLLWADPQYMPEHLALWSLKHFGPRASSAVEKLRDSRPGAGPGEHEAAVIEHQTRVSMIEGALVGGPFIVLIPFAFCAALLAQAQMALELAALAGYTPDDEMRACVRFDGRGKRGADEDDAPSRAPRWQEAAPGHPGQHGHAHGLHARPPRLERREAEPAPLGASDRSARGDLARQSRAAARLGSLHGDRVPKERPPDGCACFFVLRERRSAEAGITVRKAPSVRIAMSAGLVRIMLLIALPVLVAVIALLTGADIGSGKLASAGIFLIAVSWLITLAWLGYRWWRSTAAR